METSNSPELVSDTTTEVASPVESSVKEGLAPIEATKIEPSIKDAILARKGAEDKSANPADKNALSETPKVDEADKPASPEAPKFEANFKYKAFGKEKEIPDLFRGVIKDADTEKQVREVFTRADAFDDMKGRHENLSREHSQLLNNFSSLDKDVRKATGFLNNRDYDNFFAMMRVSDQEILQYLQNKAQYMQDPSLKQAYTQQVQLRANEISQKEQVESLQSERQQLAVQHRTMQLDMALARPDVSSTASAWDTTAGEMGAFRQLVMQEAANHYHLYKQDLTAEQAVELALKRYGKFVPGQAPQAFAPSQSAPVVSQEMQSPQAGQPQIVPPQKPTIPTMQGKGTSPIKQAPKTLDDLKRLSREAQQVQFEQQY